MKIVSSGMQMASTHASAQHHEIKESLRMWVGDRRPDFEGRGRPASRPPADTVRISDAGRAAQSSEAAAIDESADETSNDPRLTLLRLMLRYMTGQDIEVFNSRELQPKQPPPDIPQAPTSANAANPPRPAGWGMEYDRHESYTETEQTSFSASGTVQTADGREISFKLELSMSRSYHEESDVRLRLGDAARQQKDPLVLNFAGTAAQLLDQRFSFDLDADGTAESINRLAAGSGFLVFDRNGDGKANDGSELFGTQSGNGFAELAALDIDNNGWIDENDASYAQLKVWTPDAEGNGALRSLKAANVGALSVASIATPFDLRNPGNEKLGQIRSSSVFLQENGEAGTIQQVDLSV